MQRDLRSLLPLLVVAPALRFMAFPSETKMTFYKESCIDQVGIQRTITRLRRSFFISEFENIVRYQHEFLEVGIFDWLAVERGNHNELGYEFALGNPGVKPESYHRPSPK